MSAPQDTRVVVLGASPKPHRYSHQAVVLLADHGYEVTPVHPKAGSVGGITTLPTLQDVAPPVHTLTLYLNPARLEPLCDAIVALAPQRVIFNPGSESSLLQQRLDQAGIHWLEACTLVLLRMGTF